MPRLARLALVVSTLLGPVLQAQPAFLVEDIAAGSASPLWPIETEWVALGDLAVFTTYDAVHGFELWKSDGTSAGTSLILDVCPGICSSRPDSLAAMGGAVFFQADDGVHGPSLWKTDGTAAGTTLVREVRPLHTIALGSVLLFQGPSQDGGLELWRSDGTRAGTFPLPDLGVDSIGSAPWLGYAGGLLLFAADDPVHGHELWKTDGTAAGTSFLLGLSGLDGRPATGELYPSIGNRLFFLDGFNLWVSDGTVAGTSKVSDVFVWGDLDGFTPRLAALGSQVFFSGQDAQGLELWKSDGTPAGTVRVKDVVPGGAGSDPREITALGNHVFFRSSTPPRLWKSDGTAAGTVPVAPGTALDFAEVYNGLRALGNRLVFFAATAGAGHEPWVTDGTEAGTLPLADVLPGAASSFNNGGLFDPSGLPLNRLDGGAVAGGEWIFRADTPSGGTVWKSDGTPAGTGLVEAIHDGTGASGVSPSFDPAVPSLADLGGTLILAADDDGGNGDGGTMDLWRSDGSATGTSRIDGGVVSDTPTDLARLGGHVYFLGLGRLWRTDGDTPESFDDDPWNFGLTPAGPHLFYLRSPLSGGDQLLQAADGTTVDGVLSTTGWSLGDLTAAGMYLFFVRRTLDGEELWRSAGAPNDAARLWTFPYAWPGQLGSLAGLGNSVLFASNDGATGRELWFSDGTVAGTRRVRDIVPGAGSSDPRSIVAAGALAFFVADDGVAGAELWRSDGTASGTFRLKDVRAGSQPSWIRGITAHGDRVLFAADDGVNGVELWTSDGTAAGTFLVKDIRPGSGSSFPGAFRAAGHVVLFAADDGAHGLELWRTDGTAEGTFLVQDVFSGPEPSSPAGFTLSGGYVYFTATDQTHGFELWALDRAALGPSRTGDFHNLIPCRVFDSRSSTPLVSGAPRTLPVGGTCGIPGTAKAVSANLTVVGPTASGYVSVYPAGIQAPSTASVTFSAGQVRSNNLQLGLLSGHADARAFVGGGTVHLVLDVTGYYE